MTLAENLQKTLHMNAIYVRGFGNDRYGLKFLEIYFFCLYLQLFLNHLFKYCKKKSSKNMKIVIF